MKKIFFSLFLLMFQTMAPALSAAEEIKKLGEVVVTATRLQTPVREVGSAITVITNHDIQKKNKEEVADLLREVPGLDVVRSGGPGANTSIFIRGANAEHTLVLIDGVEMNDPVSARRSFNFADLSVDNIERIEILRGPQSTLYGSDAIGGVINIITKKGEGKPSFTVVGEGGSFRTFRESAGLSGGDDRLNYSFSIARFDTDGISKASEKDGNREEDGDRHTTLSARLGVSASENFDLDFIARYVDAGTDIDNAGGAGGDDPNHQLDAKRLFLRTQGRLLLFDERWEQKIRFSLTDHDREDRNDPDPDHPSDSLRSTFNSRFLKFDWQHDLYLHEDHTLTFGLESERDQGKSDYHSVSAYGPYDSLFPEKKIRTTGYYLQDQIKIKERLFATLGARLDDNSRFGSKTTWRVASSWEASPGGTRIKGSYGTGFKAPSLYQLFAPASSFGPIGNMDLAPEKSRGWDVGFEQPILHNRLEAGLTYFKNRFDNLIDFDFGTGYRNISGAASKGLECFVAIHPFDDLNLRLDYTYTDTEDREAEKDLLRRARNKLSATLDYRFLDKGTVDVGLHYVGKREDKDYSVYPAPRVTLGGYTVVDLAASFEINPQCRLFARVENLFDKVYEEVKGFGTPGRSAYAGIKLSF